MTGVLGLMVLGLVLGLRHGVDWDHIAAIADITGSAVDQPAGAALPTGRGGAATVVLEAPAAAPKRARHGMMLASVYALGHATVVMILGLLAIWTGSLLPSWLDPIMERLVGATLLLLGLWILFTFWRHGGRVRLMSRWMLLFALVREAWMRLTARLAGRVHQHPVQSSDYGVRTAFGVGAIHGIGAETGSQALLLATTAGVTSASSSTLLLLSFVVGLMLSNSAIGVFSTAGFVSTQARRAAYTAIALLAGVFSVALGLFFLAGQGSVLPDLQSLFQRLG